MSRLAGRVAIVAGGAGGIGAGGDLSADSAARGGSAVARFSRLDILHNNAALTACDFFVARYHGDCMALDV